MDQVWYRAVKSLWMRISKQQSKVTDSEIYNMADEITKKSKTGAKKNREFRISVCKWSDFKYRW